MMRALKKIGRLVYINYILLKYGLDEIVLGTRLFKPLRFLIILSPSYWFIRKKQDRGVRIRLACEALGPIFVKFGQLLSTRLDLLPEDIAVELVKLQDKVPPFCGIEAQKMVEKAYGQPVDEVFKTFDTTPLASASIAQVHAATLHDGKEVVVKILRPNIKKQIEQDIDLLITLARLTEKFWRSSQRFHPTEVVIEFKKSMLDEQDMIREAANASQLRRNFHQSDLLYVPEVHWPLTKKNILVIERIYGTPVSNIETLKEKHTDLKKLAERGVEIFFTQVFRDCFFHADMHPGNVWVSLENPRNPQYMALDFGIIGTLGPEDQRYLAENFLAFFKRNYRRVAELHVESGWVPKETRIDEFEASIRSVCEPIFERPLKDISFGKTLLRLFQTARRFNMEIQPQLVLLQKTLISVEGLGRQLYPDLDLWHTAKPFLEDWIKSQIGPKALVRQMKRYGPYWFEKLPEIPKLVHSVMDTAVNGYQNKQPVPKNNIKPSKKRFGFLAGLAFSGLTLATILWVQPELLLHEHAKLLATGLAGLSLGILISQLSKPTTTH